MVSADSRRIDFLVQEIQVLLKFTGIEYQIVSMIFLDLDAAYLTRPFFQLFLALRIPGTQ